MVSSIAHDQLSWAEPCVARLVERDRLQAALDDSLAFLKDRSYLQNRSASKAGIAVSGTLTTGASVPVSQSTNLSRVDAGHQLGTVATRGSTCPSFALDFFALDRKSSQQNRAFSARFVPSSDVELSRRRFRPARFERRGRWLASLQELLPKMDAAQTLQKIVDRSCELYSLPAVACEILELTSDPAVGATRLTACLERDPALTVKVLRVVNSSLFGLTRPVGNLNQAISLLGVKPLKMLVFGFTLPRNLVQGEAAEVLSDYWRHTLTKAVAARQLCELFGDGDSDEAFLAGLLSDLGMLTLIQEVGDPYIQVVWRVRSVERDLLSVERQVLGFDHVQLTARLLQKWRMPRTLIDAISAAALPYDSDHDTDWLFSSGPDEKQFNGAYDSKTSALTDETLSDANIAISTVPEENAPRVQSLAGILRMAELFALLLAERQTDVLPELLAEVRKNYSLSDMKLASLTHTLEHSVSELADVLSFKLPGRLDYAGVLAEAYDQLATLAAEAVPLLAKRPPRSATPDDLAQQLLHEVERLSSLVTLRSDDKSGTAAHDDGSMAAASKRAEPDATTAPRNKTTDQNASLRSNRGSGGAAAAVQSPGKSFVTSPAHTSPRFKPSTATDAAAPQVAPTVDELLFADLSTAILACRQIRCGVSLLLANVDRWEEVVRLLGESAAHAWHRQLITLCRQSEIPGANCYELRPGRVAIVLPNCDREASLAWAHELLTLVRARNVDEIEPQFSISLGLATVALPPRNFAPQQLLEAAQRCLFAAQRSRNCVKSVEVY
jgi:HD-like signal output (HDOD) protein/GGDEF domain-containing protein